jgi:hypothetical protein
VNQVAQTINFVLVDIVGCLTARPSSGNHPARLVVKQQGVMIPMPRVETTGQILVTPEIQKQMHRVRFGLRERHRQVDQVTVADVTPAITGFDTRMLEPEPSGDVRSGRHPFEGTHLVKEQTYKSSLLLANTALAASQVT